MGVTWLGLDFGRPHGQVGGQLPLVRENESEQL